MVGEVEHKAMITRHTSVMSNPHDWLDVREDKRDKDGHAVFT